MEGRYGSVRFTSPNRCFLWKYKKNLNMPLKFLQRFSKKSATFVVFKKCSNNINYWNNIFICVMRLSGLISDLLFFIWLSIEYLPYSFHMYLIRMWSNYSKLYFKTTFSITRPNKGAGLNLGSILRNPNLPSFQIVFMFNSLKQYI